MLKQHDFIYCGEYFAGQILFVRGNFEDDTQTQHIHVVKWRGAEWNNYINFRDYLNTHPKKAMMYDECKQKLAVQFSHDRKNYTAGKQELIDCLLKEAITGSLNDKIIGLWTMICFGYYRSKKQE